MTMTLIETKTLGTAASTIVFTSVPQDGTDLMALLSLRNSEGTNIASIAFNTGGTYTNRWLNGTGSSVSTDTSRFDYVANSSGFTASTFGNSSVYIPNYTGSTAKSFSSDGVSENNATAANQVIIAGLWSGTDAITTITFTAGGGGNFAIGSTISLYKITKGSDGIVTTS
jgi:hypothetical protein